MTETTQLTSAAHGWSMVADAWDTYSDRVEANHEAESALMLERLTVQPGDRVLELACGPGRLAATWSARVGPVGSVLISDVAPGMVDVARRRASALANVSVAQLDVSRIDQPDASFDVIACRMGLMFAPEPSVAAHEIARVAAPGARIAVMVWGAIEQNPWMAVVGMAGAMSGILVGGPPVGPGGPFSLGDPSVLQTVLEAAGLREVAVELCATVFRSASIDEHVAMVTALAGPMAAAFSNATASVSYTL